MMKINEIYTPAILLNLDYMEHNLKKYCDEAAKYGKQVWPMIKTHKSTELAKLQAEYGCTGYLCGTLDEAEAMCAVGMKNIMYAYPVATDVSIARVVELAKKCPGFIIRIDCLDAAEAINAGARKAGVTVSYTIIIDSGLHRFGVKPEKAVEFAGMMKSFDHLRFKGISSHPGHVYSACCHDDIEKYCKDEVGAIAAAADALRDAGYELEIISSGSTPTFGARYLTRTLVFTTPEIIFSTTLSSSPPKLPRKMSAPCMSSLPSSRIRRRSSSYAMQAQSASALIRVLTATRLSRASAP